MSEPTVNAVVNQFYSSSHQADPTTIFIPKVIHPSETKYRQERQLLRTARNPMTMKGWISNFMHVQIMSEVSKIYKIASF